MMYEFPVIDHIKQVEAAIEGNKSFIKVVKDYYTIFNYVVMGNDTFPEIHDYNSKVLRECRGIVFSNSDGKVLSRRFHKFFNLGEREETAMCNIDFSMEHIILEKIDGSMVTPIYIEEHKGFRWGTKMGLSEVALDAERWVSDKVKYYDFAEMCHRLGITPIFEFISPKNRIVIKYEEPNLILLAMRVNNTGEYLNYEYMVNTAATFDIPVVKKMFGDETDINKILKNVSEMKGVEGIVIRFANGHMLKCKASEYVLHHRAKSYIENDRYIAEVWLKETHDDLIAALFEEDRKTAEKFINKLSEKFLAKVDYLISYYKENVCDKMDRKTFALNSGMNVIDKSMIFAAMDGKDIRDSLKNKLLNMTNNEKNYANMKEYLDL